MMYSLTQQVPEQDLLKEWLKRIRLQNSNFAIHRTIQIPDSKLTALFDFFLDFFGSDYFKTSPREVKLIKLKAKDSAWFYQLLANDDYPSLVQLFEINYLLQFLTDQQPGLVKILHANTKSQAFRNYLFEGIIFEMLHCNKVKFEPKPQLNGKEWEGFLWIEGLQILFECKKLYSYQLPGIGFVFTVHEEFFRLWQKSPVSLNGYVTLTSNNDLKLKKYRPSFNQHFKDFFQQVKQTGQVHFQREIMDENNEVVGKILFEQYNAAVFDHYVSLISDTAVCFRVMPPVGTTIEEELKEIQNTKLLFKFSMMESASVAFLLQKLDKERKSQSDLRHLPRIFFFDNEIYRGTEFGLFQSERGINSEAIQAYINSKETGCGIKCMIEVKV